MKLEPKHITPYFSHGLKVQHTEYGENDTIIIDDVESIHEECVTFKSGCDYYFNSDFNDCEIKLVLRPLSELDVDDEVNTPEYISKCCYSYVEHLLSQHYDIFGLIDKELAININDIER